ncbi:hypothetical protein BUALT_Bualt02G0152600 [Buddleja alternifolia]|uniref:Uncharacterized protein n=1 Tax=Buddleja alternifolia TaxID=168488 RepID=A0AAV6Y4M6_9LAMI|nr:hypothetical protein BUALT_Bualt02G0152600 [Buddleja alternifolia]
MSCCLKPGFSVSDIIVKNRAKQSFRVCSSLQFKDPNSNDFCGNTRDVSDQISVGNFNINKAPKLEPVYICQLAEMNPDAIFLKVNYEQHKPMCYALRVHVLPFFRFYRGAQGRVCSFSCTNATIKKFKDALAKHGTERCSLGPTKGLDESELLALASIDLISRDLVPNSTKEDDEKVEDLVLNETAKTNALSKVDKKMELKEGNAMVMA